MALAASVLSAQRLNASRAAPEESGGGPIN
jgi:hypothetical protein